MSNTLGTKRLGTVLALIVAFAIALAMIVTPAAHAAGDAAPAAPTKYKVGNIDDSKDTHGSIIVHKYTEPAAAERGNGTELTGEALPKGEVLKGVNFEIYKVNGFDIHDGAKWDTLKNVTVGEDGSLTDGTNTFTKGDNVVDTQATDAKGKATFANLAFGAYIVVEADSTAVTKADGTTKVNLPKKIAPFIVTIPFPTGGDVEGTNGWLYDVHVYPKNQITSNPTKELASTEGFAAKTGELKWKITVPVPVTGKAFTKFEVQDNLKHGTTTVDATDPVVKIGDDVTLAKDTDYTLSEESSLVKVTFEDAGLTKLNAPANKGKAVTVVLSVKLPTALDNTDNDAVKNQVLNNDYKLVYNYDGGGKDKEVPPPPGTDTPPGTPPAGPIAYFGDYKLHKVSSDTDPKADLKGAQFAVFASDADAKAYAAASADKVETLKKAILTGLESNDKGIVDIQDLFLGGTPEAKKTYYVVETKAPDGFVLPTGDAAVTAIEVSSTTGTADLGDKEVPNTPVGKIPSLPLTGASGQLLMTLGGAAIVLFAAGTVLVTRRRKA